MDVHRLFDYFAVYSLNEEQIISPHTPSLEKDRNSSFSSNNTLSDFKAISSLRLRITNADDILMPAKSDFLLFNEIVSKDKKRVWLEIVYGQINGKIR